MADQTSFSTVSSSATSVSQESSSDVAIYFGILFTVMFTIPAWALLGAMSKILLTFLLGVIPYMWFKKG